MLTNHCQRFSMSLGIRAKTKEHFVHNNPLSYSYLCRVIYPTYAEPCNQLTQKKKKFVTIRY